MPLLDKNAPRPRREPSQKEIALARQAIEDVQRTLASPAVHAAVESFAKVGTEAAAIAAKAADTWKFELPAMQGVAALAAEWQRSRASTERC